MIFYQFLHVRMFSEIRKLANDQFRMIAIVAIERFDDRLDSGSIICALYFNVVVYIFSSAVRS